MLNMEAIPKFYIKSDIKDISTKLTTWIGHKAGPKNENSRAQNIRLCIRS